MSEAVNMVQGRLGWEVGDVSTASVEKLEPHPKNVEIYGETDPDEGFVESIREKGVLEPLVIKRDKTILSGHRRWTAAKEADVGRVPVRIAEFDSELAEREALIEFNRQREKTFSQKMREAEELEEIYAEKNERERREKLSNYNSGGNGKETGTSSNSNSSSGSDNRTASEVADEVGIGSENTYRKGKKIWEKADDGDETAKEQVELLDAEKQSIHGAYTTVQETTDSNDSEDDDPDSDGDDIEQFISQQTDEWSSPPEVVRPLDDAVGGFDLDPCSGAEQSQFAEETYTADDDGLSQEWFGNVWVNPPYSDMGPWSEKAATEAACDGVDRVVFLCKGDSSTQWWQAAAESASLITAIDGRLSFGDGDSAAPFASHILVFGEVGSELVDALEDQGTNLTVGWNDKEATSTQVILNE